MSDKPSYLGLLNAIAVGELGGERLFNEWAAATPDDNVRAVLQTVALREGEHAKSFAKRINELGFAVRPTIAANHAARMDIARSTTLSDCEKFEQLSIGVKPEGTDVFARFMDDVTIDIGTGQLMGRYISEERDSNRMLQACRAVVSAEAEGSGAATDLDARLARIESALSQLLAVT
jgi:hypothetical protein